MLTMTPTRHTDVTVRGLTTSRILELEVSEFTIRMTPVKAYELALAMLKVLDVI